MKQEVIINDVAEIKEIANEISLFKTRKKKFSVQIEQLTDEENNLLENKINKYYTACGCGQGRITGVITLIGYLILVLTGIISVYELGLGKTILLYFACSMVTMLFGKIYGLWNARRSLLQLANQPPPKHQNYGKSM